jgi:hypothetical protein
MVLKHNLSSVHSVAHHARTDTLLVADRENNRTLHIDAKTGPPHPRPHTVSCGHTAAAAGGYGPRRHTTG